MNDGGVYDGAVPREEGGGCLVLPRRRARPVHRRTRSGCRYAVFGPSIQKHTGSRPGRYVRYLPSAAIPSRSRFSSVLRVLVYPCMTFDPRTTICLCLLIGVAIFTYKLPGCGARRRRMTAVRSMVINGTTRAASVSPYLDRESIFTVGVVKIGIECCRRQSQAAR